MKNKLLLLLLLAAWGARAQTVTLVQESFETDGDNGVRYTSNAFDGRTSAASVAGAFPYFTRALTNPLVNPFNTAYVSFGSNMYPVTIGNVTGSVFWAAEAVESTGTNPAATDRPAGVVTLNPINASNYGSLMMTVALADARGPSSPIITQGGTTAPYEANDFIRLQYSTDGGTTYTTIGQFLGNNSTGFGPGFMQRDVNLDGFITSADGAQSATNTLDITLRDFSFSIPGSSAALLVRVQIDQRGASEELAFDNIRVTGVANTVAPPALANIESTAVSYLEGQAATQVTSALTVTNTTGNLTGATVTISSGRVSAQDVLALPTTTGITSTYNGSTGVLTLMGSASAAAYQAALRTVTYQNSNTTNATAGTRTIQFIVANGSVTSGIASRNVVVTSALNAATTLPYQEDFTNDGEGTRYASNTFSNSSSGAAWLRTNVNPYQTTATSQSPTTFSGISNGFYWYGNNTNSVANPSRIGTLQTLPINTTNYVNLNFSLLLGASSGANASWQTADYFRVSYRQVGTSTWIPLIQFRGSSAVVAGQGNLQRDADPNAAPGSAAPTGTTLTPALASFSAALPSAAYGQTLEFQVVQVSDDIRAELAFDNLQLTGSQLVVPTVVTAAATAITSTSAALGGSVTADGGAAVTNRGVVYSSTATTPIIGGSGVSQTTNASGTGTFSQSLGVFTPGTTYYVRAYATNSVGTSYGAVVSFTTAATTATVTTAAPASITSTSAVLGGEITATGGATVTERGVVYSTTSTTPTTADIKAANGAGTGAFSATIAGLAAGTTYYVRAYATNSVGTSYGSVISFTTLAPVGGTTVVTNVSCNGGSNGTINLTPSGGVAPYTFLWSPGGQTTEDRTGLAAGTYTVTITDATGATGTVSATVTQPSALTFATASQINIACNGGATGAASISPSGGTSPYTYRWSTGATTQTITGLAAGSYSVVVTDANGCTLTRNFTITQPSALTATTSQTNVTTNGGNNGSATITVGGGTPSYTYSWSPNVSTTATASNLSAGTYTVTATDANGCTIARTFNITQPAFTAVAQNVTVNLDASGNGTLSASSVNNGSTGSGTLTYTIQKIAFGKVNENSTLTLTTPNGANFSAIRFASYGTPNDNGNGNYTLGSCNAANSLAAAQNAYVGRSTGDMYASNTDTRNNPVLGDPCGGTPKSLAVQAAYSADAASLAYACTEAGKTQYVLLTVTNGTSTSTSVAQVTVNAPPTATITSVNPTAAQRGAPVTVAGTNLSGVSTVTVNGAAATVSNLTASGFTFVVPNTATFGTGSLVVATPCAQTLTSTFSVTAPALTATVSSASPSPTSTAPIPFSVTFSQSVGTTFVASDVTVSNGTVTSGSFSGSGAGPYTFTVTPGGTGTVTVSLAAGVATDANNTGNSASNAVGVQFQAPTIVVAPASLPQGTQNVAYSQALSASGGTAPYTYAITAGALPAGLSLTNGTLAGTPAANGTFNFTVTATDASAAPGPYSGSLSYSLVIVAPAVTGVVWNGSQSTDWFTAGNWTPNQLPDLTIDATIPTAPSGGRFPAVLAGTASVRNLTCNSGATLNQSGGTIAIAANLTNNGTFLPTGGTVSLGNTAFSNVLGSSNVRFWNLTAGANGAQLSTSIGASVQRLLTLNGNFATNGNPFTLESNTTLTALVVNNGSNVVSGTVTVQRAIDPSVNPGIGYRHYAAPVSNSTVADLATSGFAPVVNPAYNTSATPNAEKPLPTVFGYDDNRLSLTNSTSSFDKGFFSPAALSAPLAVGRGYTVNIAASEVVDFQGTLSNGTITLPLTSTRNTYPEGGWQLLGNPYPAPLDYSLVAAADRVGLESAIYVYSSTSQYAGRYRVYINGIGNPVVPLGQGFFTRVASGQASATMTFRNSQRLTAPNGTTLQRPAADPRPLVQLTLQGTGPALADEAYVYFENGATSGFDAAFDAEKLANPTGLNLSTNLASGQHLSVDGQPELGTAPRVVPLAVGVPAAGSYTFIANQLLNLGAVPVYLRDRELGTLTDLRLTPSYQFTVASAAALNTTRFELVFSPQQPLATVPAALAQQVALYPNPAKTQATLELPVALGRQPTTATLLDALGRVVVQQVLPANGGSHTLLLQALASGVYSLRLSTPIGVVVKRLVIE